jgi:diaminopimelate epimerase
MRRPTEMSGARFDKYEGLGNDFIVVAPGAVASEDAVRLCDRHFGIGADGVLTVGEARSPGARASMIVHNADGSRPEMCGNGLRCVALHLARRDGLAHAEYVVDTDAGPRRCVVEREGTTAQVLISLGQATEQGEHRAEHGGRTYRFARISMGNPHAVWFGDLLGDAVTDGLGAAVSAAIAGGTNVEIVQQRGPRAADVVVWERGVGRTLACGTGAGAAAAALVLAGKAAFDEPIEIRLPGGPLEVWVEQRGLGVRLRGPARWVFSGELSSS